MLTAIFLIWTVSAILVFTGHTLAALVLDGCLQIGTWTRVGRTVFVLFGPIGVLLEGLLLIHVIRDIRRQHRVEQETCYRRGIPE
jgi:hypothetical protein